MIFRTNSIDRAVKLIRKNQLNKVEARLHLGFDVEFATSYMVANLELRTSGTPKSRLIDIINLSQVVDSEYPIPVTDYRGLLAPEYDPINTPINDQKEFRRYEALTNKLLHQIASEGVTVNVKQVKFPKRFSSEKEIKEYSLS